MLFRELETERLLLKNISFEDREFVYRHFSNRQTNKYLFDVEPLADLQGADDIIKMYVQPEPRSQHRWVLVEKERGDRIGTCGFHCWDSAAGSCELGYDLSPNFRGRGYMYEALRAVLAFAQNDMHVNEVTACIYPDNESSVKLAEKLGFVFSGQTKDEIFHGQRYTHNLYLLAFEQ